MNDTQIILSLLGGFGLFYLGGRYFCESFQRLTSSFVSRVLNLLTLSSVKALSVGFLVTCFVQSSTLTSVMAISFINGGLMELAQAMAFILGANIGATVLVWIMVLPLNSFVWLFIALGVFIEVVGQLTDLFRKKSSWVVVGTVLWSSGLLFLGLTTMLEALHLLQQNTQILANPEYDFLTQFIHVVSFEGILYCLFFGLLMAVLFDSSAVVIGLCLVLTASGWVNLPLAFAIVLGANIGTTFSALKISMGTSTLARRLALTHIGFKLVGVICFILLFSYWFFSKSFWQGTPTNIRPLYVAAFHTGFNLFNALIFLPLISFVVKLAKSLIPDLKQKEKKHLSVLGGIAHVAPSLALSQSEQEVQKLTAMVEVVVDLTSNYLTSNGEDEEVLHRVRKYEDITDKIQDEINHFLGRVMLVRLNSKQTEQIRKHIFTVTYLEEIADACKTVVEACRLKFEKNICYSDSTNTALKEFFEKIQGVFEIYFYSVTNEDEIKKKDNLATNRKAKIRTDIEMQIEHQLSELRKVYLANTEKMSAEDLRFFHDMVESGAQIKEEIKKLQKLVYGQLQALLV